MALIVLGAAKGAPGVTTITTAMAAVWPTPAILVEADPSGSDLHLLMRSENGRALQGGQRGAGVLGLATHGGNRTTLLSAPICQQTDLDVPLVIGPPHSRSAHAMGPAWNQVANSLAQLSREGDYDVLVDIGRVDDQSVTLPLVNRADIVVLMARRSLRGIAHTRRAAAIVEEHLRLSSANAAAAGAHLLIVDDPFTPARVETQWALAAKGLTRSWSILTTITHDAAGARDFFNAKSTHRDTSDFTNSVREAASELHHLARHLPTPAPVPAGVQELQKSPGAGGTPRVDATAQPSSTAPVAPVQLPAASAGQVPLSAVRPADVVWPPLPPSRRGTAGRSKEEGLDEDFPVVEEQAAVASDRAGETSEATSAGGAAEVAPEAAEQTPGTTPRVQAGLEREVVRAPEPRTDEHPQLTGAGTRTR